MIIFQFHRNSLLLVDLPSLEPGALSPITFFSFQSLWYSSSIGTHDSKADIPSLEQNIMVQQGLTTQWSMYPRFNKESQFNRDSRLDGRRTLACTKYISSIGTHDSMADKPSLEPGAVHNNIFIHFRPYGPTGYLIPG